MLSGAKHKQTTLDTHFPCKRRKESSEEEVVETRMEKLEVSIEWERPYPSLLVARVGPFSPSQKIIAFDFDGTLIEPKSGYTFPTGVDDWMFWDEDKVPNTLRSLVSKGYNVVIFSNQAGLSVERMKMHPEVFMKRADAFFHALGIPLVAFFATEKDHFRKPFPGMWIEYFDGWNDQEGDPTQTIFVGDAAGRVAIKGARKKDHSCFDRKFAANNGLSFMTPEEYFHGEKPLRFEWGGFDPSADRMLSSATATAKSAAHLTVEDVKNMLADGEDARPELYVLVGWPASGKSSFVERYFIPLGYKSVSLDEFRTKKKLHDSIQQALRDGQSIVVDNTNGKAGSREEYIRIASAMGVDAKCLWFRGMTKELAMHMNAVRQACPCSHCARRREIHKKLIPAVAFHQYGKWFEPPRKDEGFVAVKVINDFPVCEWEPVHLKVVNMRLT